MRDHRHLRANPGLAGNTFDLDRSRSNLRYLHLKQPPDHLGMRPRDDHLRITAAGLNFDYINFKPLSHIIPISPRLFRREQNTGSFADVDHYHITLDPLDHTLHQLADLGLIFSKDDVALRLPQSLQDNLFGSLGGYPTVLRRWKDLFFYLALQLSFLINLFSVFE